MTHSMEEFRALIELCEEIGGTTSDLSRDSSLVELDFDSLSRLELMMSLEQRWGLSRDPRLIDAVSDPGATLGSIFDTLSAISTVSNTDR